MVSLKAASLDAPVTETSPARTLPEIEEPLGRDLGRDSELNSAAVAIFGLAGLAIVGVASAWLMLRGDAPMAVQPDVSFEHENAPVTADVPMLRPGTSLDDGPQAGSFTLMDATGLREVVEVVPPGGAPTLAR